MRFNEREVRSLGADMTELRADDEEGGDVKFSGYTAKFGVPSHELFFGREKIEPGAFTKTLRKDDIRATWNHDTNLILGRMSAGTLSLEENSIGLRHIISPPDTHWARDAAVSIRRKDVRDMSFAFEVVRDDWGIVDGMPERRLLEVTLLDVSPVAFPAYPNTDVAVRSLLRHEGAKDEEIEGFSDRLAALRDPDLTAVEFRSILDPITRELRDRHSGSGQSPDSQGGQRKARSEARNLALDLQEIEQ